MEPDLIQNSFPAVTEEDLGPNLIRLKGTDQIKELQTVLRDRSTTRGDFIFYADRLVVIASNLLKARRKVTVTRIEIRLVVEEGLNQLPYTKTTVTTPTGVKYEGLKYEKGNCGVSIMRSGEAMEQGLRDCCRSIRIGKILIQSDEETHEAKVYYAKFPPDVDQRKVLLMYPIMSTGNTIIKAVEVLKQHCVKEANIIVLNLFCTPQGIKAVNEKYPHMKILTSEVHPIAPNHFGQKYFGTD